MNSVSFRRNARRGFTLVELLVVIAIIGILIALLAPVAAGVLYNAKVSAIKTELLAIASALEQYKSDYGSYPPSDISSANLGNTNSTQYALVAQHLAKAFPRCNVQTEIQAIASTKCDTPAQSLCFWLSGFNSDPEHPISNKVQNIGTIGKIYYQFDKARLATPNGSLVPYYYPTSTPGVPYVYFSASCYGLHNTNPFQGCASSSSGTSYAGTGILRPFGDSTITNTPTWVNSQSFQLISAGLDSNYGGNNTSATAPCMFPSGQNYSDFDKDNIANFGDGELVNSIPK